MCSFKATVVFMDEPQIQILEYITEDGKNVFRNWLLKLRDVTVRARIRVRLNRIRLGNFGDIKPVGEGVSKLRISYGPGYRVYLGQKGTTLVLLLMGGTKKSQANDIKLAQKYWAEYQRRTI
jgi:putative addiction module killer protein